MMRDLRQYGVLRQLFNDEQGVAGYVLAWLLGVPAGVLFLIFLLRGCN